ncbi:MAG: uroporphyrinogen decarboxylase [Gammaproteobacteria bacterium]|nr:uroporphyrinogen decarboxylase [Gammaproteobacteria bacterium]
MALKNDRFLRALHREPVDCTPVWIMRQAGRYLPEYRATRQRAGDFLTLCKTPELACEVTLQPLERFELDAAILFSDILTIPDAMGLGLTLEEGVGPRFSNPVRSAADIARIGIPDPESDLRYVMDAVRTIKSALRDRVPLIGFAGSPWTLATYAIEGGSSSDYKLAKKMLYDAPADAHALLDKFARAVTLYLKAQVAAGADAVMVFDSWGGALSAAAYDEFSLRYMQLIVDGLKAAGVSVPIILFTKGGGLWLEKIAATGCQGVGLDWHTDIGAARARIGNRVCLQGNMDPAILRASPTAVEREAAAILSSFGQGSGHIFNLGHGVTPDIEPDNVKALVDAVHRCSRQYHAST